MSLELYETMPALKISLTKVLRRMRECCHGNCAAQTLIVCLLVQSLIPGVCSNSTANQCAQLCSDFFSTFDLIGHRSCVLRCCMNEESERERNLDQLPQSWRTIVQAVIGDHNTCRNNVRVQYEKQTERMRFVIPQKRRWGNTIGPCISSQCGGLGGENRLVCILHKCNGHRH